MSQHSGPTVCNTDRTAILDCGVLLKEIKFKQQQVLFQIIYQHPNHPSLGIGSQLDSVRRDGPEQISPSSNASYPVFDDDDDHNNSHFERLTEGRV